MFAALFDRALPLFAFLCIAVGSCLSWTLVGDDCKKIGTRGLHNWFFAAIFDRAFSILALFDIAVGSHISWANVGVDGEKVGARFRQTFTARSHVAPFAFLAGIGNGSAGVASTDAFAVQPSLARFLRTFSLVAAHLLVATCAFLVGIGNGPAGVASTDAFAVQPILARFRWTFAVSLLFDAAHLFYL